MKGFGSDNHSGIHPELLRALIESNTDHAPSYGTDVYSEKASALFKKEFGPQTETYFVFNGTAANVLALRFLMKRHEAVLCSNVSHLNVDECGAPEFFAGKLIPLPHDQGKLTLSILKEALIRQGDQHFSQARVVSLTQPTEYGTCYSLNEIKEITTWAHSNHLYVHIDGARLANALQFLDCTYKEMTTDLGVDVVSFGGTKNGLMMGEAILVLNTELAKGAHQQLKYIRKQSAQLPSKTRFIAAQFSSYLDHQLYLQISHHACEMAERLLQGLKQIPQVRITCERQSNAVFAMIPQAWVKPLREKYFFYVWDEKTFECRLMTSWDTTTAEVDEFIHRVQQLAR
ncbi:MAG: aminotransferase class V-fold PLP-dependent enzyme [Bdellovibrio sp.]|nr:aminotransferase class V-fold PLP-dependent enzyme [Bdellovibrio sp.]